MKKTILTLFIGMIIGAFAIVSTGAFAAIGDSVTAVFAEFSYVVNGESKSLDAPVLVYEGMSYVRTTQIGNLLGYDITYKADSRTIEFNKPDPVITPTPSPEPSATPVPTATPDPNVPAPSTDPNATPAPTLDPNATPAPSVEPTVMPSPSPTPAPVASNVAQCDAIRNNYAVQIGMVGYGPGTEGQQRLKILNLQYQMSQALSAAGCN
jgi:hypothetical protein